MSTPPPGGPQTPPQPPPQPPYPQQPYPPQYPPSQPYYQPVAPPKKSNTVLIVVIVVVVIVAVVAVLAYWAFTLMTRPFTQASTITGVSFAFQYPASATTHWFGAGPITTCTSCPLTATLTSPAQYVLTLHNSDTVAHNVTGITITSFQFYLASASPDPSTASPVVVLPGQPTTITLSIGATGLSASAVVTGTVTTT